MVAKMESNEKIDILSELKALRDEDYKQFHARLVPTLDPDLIIGVRTPELRRLAARLSKSGQGAELIAALPHKYYEENNLHAFIIEKIKDFDESVKRTEELLPYIDNWATCDSFLPKVFKKNTERLLPHIEKWLSSGHTYTVRYGIKCLMQLYLDEHFDEKLLQRAAELHSEEYYVSMMLAWYFATALAKQYDAIIPILEHKSLDPWTHNKTIQKALESYRITDQQKNYLRTLR